MAAHMEARVRKHTEDISRSLEKICNIIDEYDHELYEDWRPETPAIPRFLSLIPMRYRAGEYVLELTVMVNYHHSHAKLTMLANLASGSLGS